MMATLARQRRNLKDKSDLNDSQDSFSPSHNKKKLVGNDDGVPQGYMKNSHNVLVPITNKGGDDATARTSPNSSKEFNSDSDLEDEDDSSFEAPKLPLTGRSEHTIESEGGWQDEEDETEEADDEEDEEGFCGASRIEDCHDDSEMEEARKSLGLTSLLEQAKRGVSDVEDWKFDLGDMESQVQKAQQEASNRQQFLNASMHSAEETLSRMSHLSDEMSFISHECEEAVLEWDETAETNKKQSTQTKLGYQASLQELEKKKKAKAEKDQQTANYLEQRQAQRAKRLAQAKLRIERELQEKKELEKEGAALDNSDEARRERAHQWYLRLGMISRDQLKKRAKKCGREMQLKEADIDLLPWNFNGSMVNASTMLKLSNAHLTRSAH